MPRGTPSIRETSFQGQATQRPIAQPVAFGSFVARHGAACPFGERARPECPGENEEEVRADRFVLVVSDATLDELGLAPESVRRILADLPPSRIEVVSSSEESNPVGAGHARSLHAGVVGPASRNDAAHIALATIFGADLSVSWSFKHIVHFEKIAGYEGVNSLRGYRSPKIYSPREVVQN